MKQRDLKMFSKDEVTLLFEGFDRRRMPLLAGNILVVAMLLAVLVLVLLHLDVSVSLLAIGWMLTIAGLCVWGLRTVETRRQLNSVIRKLTRRVEQLEGAERTPESRVPTSTSSFRIPAK